MRLLCACLLAAGCAADPCDEFPDETCLALEVRGPGLSVDQIALDAISGLVLSDGRSPPTADRVHALPLQLAVLPGGRFAGAVELSVRGLLRETVVGSDRVHSTVAAGEHLRVIAELGGAHANDLAGVDLVESRDFAALDGALGAGADLGNADLSRRPVDLAGLDLAGGGFVFEPLPSAISGSGIFGFSPQDVYVTGISAGTILHSTGDGKWTVIRQESAAGIDERLVGIWGSAPDNLYAFGHTNPASGAGATTPLVLHSKGGGPFSSENFPLGSDSSGVAAFGGSSATNLFAGTWATFDPVIRRSIGDSQWTRPQFLKVDIIALFAASATSIYACGDSGVIQHSTGDDIWTAEPITDNPQIVRLWAASPTNVYAVGHTRNSPAVPVVVHSSGNGQWTPESLPDIEVSTGRRLSGIFGSAPDDVWVVGERGLVLHFDGVAWSLLEIKTLEFFGQVWAGSGEVYILGSGVHHKRL